ncbi:hypothetical protein OsJ_36119 [Oryza sativa Japonica Group]|uniref:Uncharacterized protein n=2 Tax=Oryza sativa subsp. japonica TaxID=39947 RepID=A0A8J8Y1A0_ORYSJ|nr:hypothetical protein LOC_Os12g30450 [Oryza sativa Japonica Group]EAZ20514.1 hypothetical protein OsJ_36119 [Oryza sativa Japonica Group]
MGTKGNQACAAIGSKGCVLRLWGDGLGALPRGCGSNGGRRWTGLEPSVGEVADGEEGDSEEDEGSAAVSGAVLGSEVELGRRWVDVGSGGIGRSSGDPGWRCEITEGSGEGGGGGVEKDVAAVAGGGDVAEKADGEENVAAVAGGGATM